MDENTTPDKYNGLLSHFKLVEDWKYDPWAACMGTWFDVAAELHHRDECPASWRYSPGASGDGREPDSYWFEILGAEETAPLLAFGELLERYSEKLKAAGRDY